MKAAVRSLLAHCTTGAGSSGSTMAPPHRPSTGHAGAARGEGDLNPRPRPQPEGSTLRQRRRPPVATAGAPPGTGHPTSSTPAPQVTGSPRDPSAGAVEPWLMQWLDKQPVVLQTGPSGHPPPSRKPPPVPTRVAKAAATPDSPPISPMPALQLAAKADMEKKNQPVPDQKSDMPHAQQPLSPSLSSPKVDAVPPRPVSPEATAPVVPRREGKQPMPPSPPACTSAAASEATGPALPSERLRHLDKLAHVGELANQLAEPLDTLWGLRVPSLPPFQYMHRDALVDANRFLARHEHLLDMKELRDAQDCLWDLLDNGVQEGRLPGVSEARLGGLRALSEVDLMSLTEPLRQFKADYADMYDVVVNLKGGDPNWFTRYARPVQEIEAERAARIAEDNEALRLGHYTF